MEAGRKNRCIVTIVLAPTLLVISVRAASVVCSNSTGYFVTTGCDFGLIPSLRRCENVN